MNAEPESDVAALAPVPPTPLSLYQLAIEKGVDAAELSKLLDLHERIEANRAKRAFARAMNEVQKELPRIVKDGENLHTKKRYARLETISAQMNPVLLRYGFSVSFGTEPGKNPGVICFYIDVRHSEGHMERTFAEFPADKSGSMNPIQGIGSTHSYARRYLKFMAFDLVVADEDDDGQFAGFITPNQVRQINDLIEQRRKAGQNPSMAGFLRWLNVESLDKLPRREFDKAIAEQRRKLVEGNGRGVAK